MAPIGPPRARQSSRRIIQPTPTMEPNARAKYSRARITRRRPDAACVAWVIVCGLPNPPAEHTVMDFDEARRGEAAGASKKRRAAWAERSLLPESFWA